MVESRPPFRIGTTECVVDDEFVYNEDFDILKGNEFFVNGRPVFPRGKECRDGTYRTSFGFGASHNGVIYGDTNDNVEIGMRRLTGKRIVKDAQGNVIPGEHERLFENQENFFEHNSDFLKDVAQRYNASFEGFNGSEQEAREHHGDPHQKRLLRLQAWKELTESNRATNTRDLWVRSVLWKMKRDETAKWKKKTRMIGDLGVGASLRGFRLTEFLKKTQAEVPILYKGGKIEFCKAPDPVVLTRCFDELINPSGRYYFLYFSDDSCLSVRRDDGGVDFYNLDISSCDASHSPAIFKALVGLVPQFCQSDMQLLVDQCRLPLRVVSKINKRHRILMRPTRPMLYSGSTITTAINNLANLCIAKSFADMEYKGGVTIQQAADRVGYIVTGVDKPLSVPEELQFLKNSPVLDSFGKYQPMLNLGVLIRASGVCRGDLPGKGALRSRAMAFQRGILNGAYPKTQFEILDRMKRTVGDGAQFVCDEFVNKVVSNDDFQPYRACKTSIMRRYKLNDLEYSEVLDFAGCGFTEYVNNAGVSKILMLDYGLKTVADDGVGFRGG